MAQMIAGIPSDIYGVQSLDFKLYPEASTLFIVTPYSICNNTLLHYDQDGI